MKHIFMDKSKQYFKNKIEDIGILLCLDLSNEEIMTPSLSEAYYYIYPFRWLISQCVWHSDKHVSCILF